MPARALLPAAPGSTSRPCRRTCCGCGTPCAHAQVRMSFSADMTLASARVDHGAECIQCYACPIKPRVDRAPGAARPTDTETQMAGLGDPGSAFPGKGACHMGPSRAPDFDEVVVHHHLILLAASHEALLGPVTASDSRMALLDSQRLPEPLPLSARCITVDPRSSGRTGTCHVCRKTYDTLRRALCRAVATPAHHLKHRFSNDP